MIAAIGTSCDIPSYREQLFIGLTALVAAVAAPYLFLSSPTAATIHAVVVTLAAAATSWGIIALIQAIFRHRLGAHRATHHF